MAILAINNGVNVHKELAKAHFKFGLIEYTLILLYQYVCVIEFKNKIKS